MKNYANILFTNTKLVFAPNYWLVSLNKYIYMYGQFDGYSRYIFTILKGASCPVFTGIPVFRPAEKRFRIVCFSVSSSGFPSFRLTIPDLDKPGNAFDQWDTSKDGAVHGECHFVDCSECLCSSVVSQTKQYCRVL